MSKTGGGIGTNQHGIRGASQTNKQDPSVLDGLAGDDDAERQEILRLAGPVGLREFEAARVSTRPKMLAFMRDLANMDDRQFQDAAETAIAGSCILANYRGNAENIHFRATAAYHQSCQRLVKAGHDERCRSDLYNRAHVSFGRSQGYPAGPTDCNCEELRSAE